MAENNPKVTSYPINKAGGAMTNITLTILASRVSVIEDPAYNNGIPQGLQGYRIDTQPPQVVPAILPPGQIPPSASPQYLFTWLPNNNGQLGPAYEPIIFGGAEGGRVVSGQGDYVGAAGTVILQLTTNTANGGGVLVEEWM